MKRNSVLISLILAVLMLFSALPSYALEQNQAPDGTVYFYNLCGRGYLNGDCIFIQSGDSWGMIDTGHRYENTITDSTGRLMNASREQGLSNQEQYKNGREAVLFMMENYGLKHIDFIIATHSHSDHIGGVPEIAELKSNDENGNSSYIVDENTVYFYKQYRHINNRNDDLENPLGDSWHNQAFYYQAVKAMQQRGALLVEVSKGGTFGIPGKYAASFADDLKAINNMPSLSGAYYNGGAAKDYYDDVLSFRMGALQISLYNLFAHNSSFDENVNSIAAVITNGSQKIVSMADLNIEDEAEQKTAAAISKTFGTVDLFKANHHGSNSYSNSGALIDSLQPKYVVITRNDPIATQLSNRGGLSLAMLYAKENYGTDFYEVGATGFALAAELSAQGLEFYAVSQSESGVEFTDASPCINMVSPTEGWNAWPTEIAGYSDYFYIENGSFHTGWLDYNENRYYFAENGQMLRGWLEIEGKQYFFAYSGEMKTGWVKNGGWYYMKSDGGYETGWLKLKDGIYYLGTDGVMVTGAYIIDGNVFVFDASGDMQTGWVKAGGEWYYCGDDGCALTGWQKIGGKWYFFDDYGVMQTEWHREGGSWFYLGADGAMKTGWQKIGGIWYYFNEHGVMQVSWTRLGGIWYYFNSSGAMQTGAQRINGRTYKFSASGAWVM